MRRNEQPIDIDAADLPLALTDDETTPKYLQLTKQLRALIDAGTLRAGTRLPSSRSLALALGVNRNTVVATFEQLTSLGLIETRGRAGSHVSDVRRLAGRSSPTTKTRGRRENAAPERLTLDFRLGAADPSPLPLGVWRRACREAGRQLPDAGYGDPRGDAALRAQVAMYLARTRSLRVEPGQVLITAGASRAIERIAQVCLRKNDYAGVEEPGYPHATDIFRRLGGKLLSLSVDDDGVNTQALSTAKQRIRLVHVTPSHQYPLGGRLSAVRRAELIEWARRSDTLIIENDYDGEFRYGASPLPTLASTAGLDGIAYVGTFSKVLSPALRLGFVVSHTDRIEAMATRIARERDPVSIVSQRIVSWLIRSGELEKHIRRVRKHYATRRATLLSALGELTCVHSVTGHAAGLHVVVELRREFSRPTGWARFERCGVLVDRVADFQLGRKADDRLLLAYGHLTDDRILEGVRRFNAAVLGEASSAR